MSATDAPANIRPFPIALYSDPNLSYVRVESPGDEPPAEPDVVDIAVLDMNHHYANLGHESVVETLFGLGHRERLALGKNAPKFRVISFDVRSSGAVPVSPASRFPVVVGTGGPGSLDPRQNDGVSVSSQGILEDPRWEGPLWRFFDTILEEPRTAFLGICHSFGLLSRWAGVAEAVLRSDAKGKSAGTVPNILSEEARHHPWFSELWKASGGPRIEVLDSRLFDLMPTGASAGLILAHEEEDSTGRPGPAITMLELARDEDGVLPRVWGVNHHPEIGDKGLQRERLERLEQRHEVSPDWVAERRAALEAWNTSASTERGLQWTATFTFERPVRRYITRALMERTART